MAALRAHYHTGTELERDPAHHVHMQHEAADREVVALVSAALAFGNVDVMIPSIGRFLACLGPRPAAALRAYDRLDAGRFDGWAHRWIRAGAAARFAFAIGAALREFGSLEACFAAGMHAGDATIAGGLEHLSTWLRQAAGCPEGHRASASGPRSDVEAVRTLFARPSDGSACKRMCLLLRWMVRRDEIDVGEWTCATPAQLVIPLDAHLVAASRALCLTRRGTVGWKMAIEVTDALRRMDPRDPVRFDFALCHHGMAIGRR